MSRAKSSALVSTSAGANKSTATMNDQK